jgi:hypothetical protein
MIRLAEEAAEGGNCEASLIILRQVAVKKEELDELKRKHEAAERAAKVADVKARREAGAEAEVKAADLERDRALREERAKENTKLSKALADAKAREAEAFVRRKAERAERAAAAAAEEAVTTYAKARESSKKVEELKALHRLKLGRSSVRPEGTKLVHIATWKAEKATKSAACADKGARAKTARGSDKDLAKINRSSLKALERAQATAAGIAAKAKEKA